MPSEFVAEYRNIIWDVHSGDRGPRRKHARLSFWWDDSEADEENTYEHQAENALMEEFGYGATDYELTVYKVMQRVPDNLTPSGS